MTKIRRLSWLPVVDQGCCCSLETCCKVQGYISVLSSLAVLMSSIIMWTTSCSYKPPYSSDGNGVCNQPLIMINSAIGFLINGVLGFAFTTMFLTGIYQNRPQVMMPYIWLQHLNTISIIHCAILVAPHLPFISVYLSILPIALIIYCMVCANSLRLKIEQTQNGLHVPLTEQFA